MIEQILNAALTNAVKTLYDLDATPSQVQLQNTRKEFEGDFTLVVSRSQRFRENRPRLQLPK
ncbi:MAG: hypothetical protein U0Z17_05240 [Bacteroidales bacterium]